AAVRARDADGDGARARDRQARAARVRERADVVAPWAPGPAPGVLRVSRRGAAAVRDHRRGRHPVERRDSLRVRRRRAQLPTALAVLAVAVAAEAAVTDTFPCHPEERVPESPSRWRECPACGTALRREPAPSEL